MKKISLQRTVSQGQQREILRPLPALCSEPSVLFPPWYSPPTMGAPRMELHRPDLPSLLKLPTQPDKLVNNRTLVKEGRWSLGDGKWMGEPRGGPTHREVYGLQSTQGASWMNREGSPNSEDGAGHPRR